jgi:recombination protein RecT
MTATVRNEVAKREAAAEIGGLIKQYSSSFAQVLPSHCKPDTFVRLSQGLLRRNADLAEAAAANPQSFLAALLECARLGHEPGTDQYALTQFNNNKTGVPEIVGIEQYQGEIERMYRAGAVSSVVAEVVRANDYYEYDPHTMSVPDHRPGWYTTNPPGQGRHLRFATEEHRGDMIAVYAYARMTSGSVSRVVEMARDEVMKHKAVAKSKKFWDGPWEKSMWLKTGVHELEKWVPTSSEYIRERMRAGAMAAQAPVHRVEQGEPVRSLPAAEVVDTVTGEVVDDGDPVAYAADDTKPDGAP